MLSHEDIMDGVVAEVTRYAAPLNYVVPAYLFDEAVDLASLPCDTKDIITNGWLFETQEEAEEYPTSPAKSFDSIIEDLRTIQELHIRCFLESNEITGVGRFIQRWRNLLKEYIRHCPKPSFFEMEDIWKDSYAAREAQSILFEFLDSHIREGDILVWGALQKVHGVQERERIMVQRLVGVWSTLGPLGDLLELDINSIDGV
ncbi:hypothetical protein FA13DRAFT_1801999 [Coprinellus micaceus]|uniref:Uncharacterized protein n=1 Tax=Coprinellus micaceus TaxID=71717 RepID=A0A4Y7SDK9_COPMI|nr:hypothetical protein FA13DRAFT_1801999 [Coprinellus micaceus]